MNVEPYLFFEGRCEEALAFYQEALGAKVTVLLRYKESPDQAMCVPGTEEMIMHANLQIGGTTVMFSDGLCEKRPVFQGFALSISLTDRTRAELMFAALANGGQVQMPLAETFWSPLFGMVSDRFGVSWMINVTPAAY